MGDHQAFPRRNEAGNRVFRGRFQRGPGIIINEQVEVRQRARSQARGRLADPHVEATRIGENSPQNGRIRPPAMFACPGEDQHAQPTGLAFGGRVGRRRSLGNRRHNEPDGNASCNGDSIDPLEHGLSPIRTDPPAKAL